MLTCLLIKRQFIHLSILLSAVFFISCGKGEVPPLPEENNAKVIFTLRIPSQLGQFGEICVPIRPSQFPIQWKAEFVSNSELLFLEHTSLNNQIETGIDCFADVSSQQVAASVAEGIFITPGTAIKYSYEFGSFTANCILELAVGLTRINFTRGHPGCGVGPNFPSGPGGGGVDGGDGD